jgi:hypothetical protein
VALVVVMVGRGGGKQPALFAFGVQGPYGCRVVHIICQCGTTTVTTADTVTDNRREL